MAAKQTIAELLIEIGVDGKDAVKTANKIEKNLKDVGKAGEKAGKGVDKTNKSLFDFEKFGEQSAKIANTIAAALTGVATVVGVVGKEVLTVGTRFESLRAQLKTTTGSAEGAAKAFKFIQDFASKTPFAVEQVTEAFVKLNNFGIEPTEKVLTAFGDFASSFGKDFNDIIEAVTDATTGEFERLKEFGIKTSSQGDRVKLTFRGVTKEIGKNAEEIQDFLVGLAESNFGGAMAEQALTAGGLISNLGDTWSQFMDTVANMGPLEEFKLLLNDLSDAAGSREGLAKQIAGVLTTAIRKLRVLLKGNLIPTLERVISILGFVVEHFDAFVAILVGSKLTQGISGLVTGFRSMGVAAAGSLGPIGLIIQAMTILIPLALEAGNALGDVLAKQTAVTRGPGGKVATQQNKDFLQLKDFEGGSDIARAQARASQDVLAAQRKVEAALARGDEGVAKLIKQTEEAKAQEELRFQQRRANKFLSEQRKLKEQQDAVKAQQKARTDASVQATLAGLVEEDKSALLESLVGGDLTKLTGRKKKQAEAGIKVIEGGGSLEQAKQAAAAVKGKGGRRKKKKKEKEEKKAIQPPTTVSEFFGAAARGELGTIADRTPSVRDIEPTVAVDITNNNFNFRDTFNISGTTDPVATGKSVIKEVKAEFDRRMKNAGQTLATNMAR